MKILCFADVHIHGWPAHSTYDNVGVPSRLRQYVTLFEDIRTVAERVHASHILIAGDIMQTHSPKPMVSNTVRAAFSALTRDAPYQTHVIPGNHDVDQKSGRFDPVHDGLRSLLAGMDGLAYYDAPDRVCLGADTTLYVRPWQHDAPEYDEWPDADIFMGHGLVVGSSDPYNYKFTSGFDPDKLAAKYALSIIGDVHQAQAIRSQSASGIVLVPGQPMQVNYSSGANTGIWIHDTETLGLKHLSTQKFARGAEYHQFLTADTIPDIIAPNVHYRKQLARRDSTAKTVAAAEVKAITDINILTAAEREWGLLRSEDDELGRTLLQAAYNDHTTAGAGPLLAGAAPARLQAGKLRMRNWYSVGEAEFDFGTMVGDVLVVGANGSGKSSIAEAFYWCLTGKTTKETPVTDLSNNLTKAPAFVSLELLDGTTTYLIERSRDPAHLLEIYANGSLVTKASALASQEWIYGLLGFRGPEDILTLLYFSCAKPSNFTEFTTAQQFEFLGRLTDADRFDAFKSVLSEWAATATEAHREAEAAATATAAAVERRTEQLNALLAQIEAARAQAGEPDYAAELAAIAVVWPSCAGMSREAVLEALSRSLVQAQEKCDPTAATRLADARRAAAECSATVRMLETNLNTVQLRIAAAKARYQVATVDQQCPECLQAIHDTTIADRLIAALRKDGAELRDTIARLASARDASLAATTLVEAAQADLSAAADVDSYIAQIEAFTGSLAPRVTTDTTTPDSGQLQYIQRDLEDARVLAAQARANADAALPRRRVLTQIKDKLLQKNSPLQAGMTRGVFEALVQRVNDLVGNPRLLKVTPIMGKVFDFSASFNGEKPIRTANMSTGQRRLLDVLNMFALGSLFEQRYGIDNGILGVAMYDEIVTYLDPELLDAVFSALTALRARTRIMITHDENLQSYYDKIVRAERVQGLTTYHHINTQEATV